MSSEPFVHRYQAPVKGHPLTLLLLHGTGGDENSLWDLGRDLSPGAGRLSIRGRVREGTANRFFRRLAEGVFDMEDLHRQTGDLIAFLKERYAEEGIDPQRVVAVGYSNGANIAASMLLTDPSVMGSALLLRAMVPFEPDSAPSLSGKSILMMQGVHDPILPIENARRLHDLFSAQGADVEMQELDTGHGLTSTDIRTSIDFLASLRERF